jgi:hypothetical protein
MPKPTESANVKASIGGTLGAGVDLARLETPGSVAMRVRLIAGRELLVRLHTRAPRTGN